MTRLKQRHYSGAGRCHAIAAVHDVRPIVCALLRMRRTFLVYYSAPRASLRSYAGTSLDRGPRPTPIYLLPTPYSVLLPPTEYSARDSKEQERTLRLQKRQNIA